MSLVLHSLHLEARMALIQDRMYPLVAVVAAVVELATVAAVAVPSVSVVSHLFDSNDLF